MQIILLNGTTKNGGNYEHRVFKKIRLDIHKNSHKMNIHEIIELQKNLTKILNLKLKLQQDVRLCDLGAVRKYASKSNL